jgi:hypothetical protein
VEKVGARVESPSAPSPPTLPSLSAPSPSVTSPPTPFSNAAPFTLTGMFSTSHTLCALIASPSNTVPVSVTALLKQNRLWAGSNRRVDYSAVDAVRCGLSPLEGHSAEGLWALAAVVEQGCPEGCPGGRLLNEEFITSVYCSQRTSQRPLCSPPTHTQQHKHKLPPIPTSETYRGKRARNAICTP